MTEGIHVIAEVDALGNLKKSYTWGPGVDNLLAFTDHTTTNTYYPLTDHLGSVHAVVDSTGAVVESYRYDAWGRVLGVYDAQGVPLTGSAIGNHFLWQGRWYSWRTGLYYFRARWYDPVVGRWCSKDPIGISGGLNQYVFCGGNPVNGRDPLGRGNLFGPQNEVAVASSLLYPDPYSVSDPCSVGAPSGWGFGLAATAANVVRHPDWDLNPSYVVGVNWMLLPSGEEGVWPLYRYSSAEHMAETYGVDVGLSVQFVLAKGSGAWQGVFVTDTYSIGPVVIALFENPEGTWQGACLGWGIIGAPIGYARETTTYYPLPE